MCQCCFVSCNKCTSLVGVLITGYACAGAGSLLEISAPYAQFCCKSKIVFKNKTFFFFCKSLWKKIQRRPKDINKSWRNWTSEKKIKEQSKDSSTCLPRHGLLLPWCWSQGIEGRHFNSRIHQKDSGINLLVPLCKLARLSLGKKRKRRAWSSSRITLNLWWQQNTKHSGRKYQLQRWEIWDDLMYPFIIGLDLNNNENNNNLGHRHKDI